MLLDFLQIGLCLLSWRNALIPRWRPTQGGQVKVRLLSPHLPAPASSYDDSSICPFYQLNGSLLLTQLSDQT
jgi:hypothetical protein